MKKIFAAFCLLTISHFLFAQHKLDSLIAITKKGTDKEKVSALNALSDLLVYDKPAEAKLYAFQSIALAGQINFKEGLGDAYNKSGIIYDVTADYDSAVIQYNKALIVYNGLKNPRGIGSAVNNLGLVYWNMSDYEKALEFFFKALKNFETIRNDRFIANALNNIGLVYSDVNKPELAITYHLKAKLIYEKLGDPYLKGAVYNNLGNAYSNINKTDSAGYYYQEAISMQTIAEDKYGLSIAYNGYASYQMSLFQDDSAMLYYNRALALKKEIGEQAGEVIILINISNIQGRNKDVKSQLATLLQALSLAKENKLRKEQVKVYEQLASLYEKINSALSYQYYKSYSTLKDSIFNEASSQQINELNTRYQTGKKELQLVAQEATIKSKNYLLAGITVIGILLILLTWSFFRRNRLKQQAKYQAAILHEQEQAVKGILVAEENERQRIAADLHDGIGQMMSVARMNMSALETEMNFKDETQQNNFEKVIGLLDESARELRAVSHQMMPNALLKSGLSTAVRTFISRIDPRVLDVSLHTEGLQEILDSNVEMVLYRVIQECVNNVLKHAGASKLDISIINDSDGVSISIEDNGRGFDVAKLKSDKGIGLSNISSRVMYLKGSVDYDSTPGRGTLVAINIPNIIA